MTISEPLFHLDDQVHEALELSPYLTRSKGVQFETAQGRITLRGEVDTYYQKQMATEALKKVDGICEIDNQLEVNWA
jgi:osmotically-inducible protein OsmY